MQRALELARQGWGMVAPNPMVGAVVVRDQQIVGEGFHTAYGEPHAEIHALNAAGNAAQGATLYVTLEPCAHHGKTPPCADAVIRAGITRVVVAILDPTPVAAGGVSRLRDAGVTVDLGTGRAEALQLSQPYFHALSSTRPWITLKLAVTLDAAIAERAGSISRVTGGEARHYAHWLRAGHDAIGVGLGTVRADDPQLTVRESAEARRAPVRVVFSRSGELPLASKLARTARDVPVMVTMRPHPGDAARRLVEAGAQPVAGDTLREQLDALRALDVRSILVEGGAQIAAELWRANLIDRLILLQAPKVFGQGGLNAFAHLTPTEAMSRVWTLAGVEQLGDDVALTYNAGGPAH